MARVIILGAGFAGLSAGLKLCEEKEKIQVVICEKDSRPGGLSKTYSHNGVRFDLGPHIFFKRDKSVSKLWHQLLPGQFSKKLRRTRIYWDGRYVKTPLNIFDAFTKLGLLNALQILFSFIKSKLNPPQAQASSEDWVTANFGKKLFLMFFKVYNEKIWGIPCSQLTADWAGLRVKHSLFRMLWNALFGGEETNSKTFDYPTQGASMMIDAFLSKIHSSGKAEFKSTTEVLRIIHDSTKIIKIETIDRSTGTSQTIEGDYFISTLPIDELVKKLSPLPPKDVIDAANKLYYRNMIAVNFIVSQTKVSNFKEHWVDIHSPQIKMLRVSNFGNYDPGMTSNNRTGITTEYFCFESDQMWKQSDAELIATARNELKEMKLVSPEDIEDAFVVKVEKVFPVCYVGYEDPLSTLTSHLSGFKNLQTIGRSGMYKYNNMHHSVLTGILAAENILGSNHDIWNIQASEGFGGVTDTLQKNVNQSPQKDRF